MKDDDELSLLSSDTDFSTIFATSNHSSFSTTNPNSLTMISTHETGEQENDNIIELHILKLHDPSIINMIEKQLCKVDGIENVEINFATGNAIIKYDKILLGVRDIVEKVECLGFKCKLINNIKSNQLDYFTKRKDIPKWKNAFFYSLSFTIPIIIISCIQNIIDVELVHGLFAGDLVSFLLSIPVQFGIGKIIYFKSFKEFRYGNFTMDYLLTTIATLTTFIFSCASMIYSIFMPNSSHPLIMFDTSITLITFFTLNRYLENIIKRKSSDSITKLLSLIPEMSTIIYVNSKTGEVTGKKIIPTECLQKGDIVKIVPGAIVPADGKVISGLSVIDESIVTGRNINKIVRNIRRGDNVIGGSINGLGSFEMQVLRAGNNTILSQMIKLVKDTQPIKAPIQLFADKFTSYFIPIIILLGMISFILWKGSSISILVIVCPFTLALSGSIAVMVGMGSGVQNGMLIKGGRTFEVGSKITKIVFNKTGILTQGKFDVAYYELYSSDITLETFFMIIGAAESSSDHPIGKAIVDYSKQLLNLNDDDYDVDINNFESMTGYGIKCDILLNTASDFSFYATSKTYNVLIGNLEFISHFYQIEIPHSALIIKEKQELLGRTTIFVAINNEFIGLLFLSDIIKPEAKVTVDSLKSMGLKVSMITADQKLTAQSIASQCGIDEVYSQLSPKGKLNVIQSLQLSNEIVAMVGNSNDVNDSQALSKADVSISLTKLSTDTDDNMEFSADIILMNENLINLLSLFDLLRKLFNRIKYNFIYISLYNMLSLSINMLLLFLGIHLHPILAGIFMSLNSLSVLSSILLLKSWEKREKPLSNGNVDRNFSIRLIDWFRTKRLSLMEMRCKDSRVENENIIEL
ncbi:haloacid dehalogenase-like hydrolase-domain-containing protein [Glomus cerebriforme]|uniref:P-type Cu(+) transporter n=1 Tax=Glomus cerebriforme TaxID=658196 RepID=A0A397TPX2_9GLOM|nr:haloacid dehalogenase-like hydrolase-domain-containing protein [Glomus cerebriforme]